MPRAWTDLTPAWMTAALSTSFPGAVVGAVEVVDRADGTNRRARVRLGYRSGQGPDRVFVKRDGRPLPRLALLALGALEAEARLCLAGVELPLERPRFFAAGVDRRRLGTVVVMEDVTARAGRPNRATEPLTVAEVRSGLAGLARLHAAWWGRPLPPALGFLRPWRLGPVWAPVSRASLARAVHRLRTLGEGRLVPPGADTGMLERGFRRWAAVAATGPRTVLHGDPHPGNTYTLPGPAAGLPGTVGFYDWQLVRTGNWSHDVGYFVVSSLAVADRRDHERALLDGYLADLRAAGAPAPGPDAAWSLYSETPAFGLGTWLHTLAGGAFQPVDLCLATIERFAAAYADHDVARSVRRTRPARLPASPRYGGRMTDSRPHLEPGPDHPITVQPHAGRVTVEVAGTRLADTSRALELREASYPPVLYVPLDDVDRSVLQASDRHTYCPYKGEASYYDIAPAGADRLDGAVWYYPDPYPAVGAIEGHVAFYPDRVTISAE